MTEFEQQQGHVIYQAFNNELYDTLEGLSIKLPHNAKLYRKISKLILANASRDVTYPMKVWIDNIGDNDEILRDCTPENVQAFLKLAPTVPLLECLEIEKNWHLFKPDDVKKLWGYFENMFKYSDAATLVPVEFMTDIQNMLAELQSKGMIDMSKDVDFESASDILGFALEQNEKIKKHVADINEKMGFHSAPAPPTYAKRIEKIDRY
jgi:hypothetical protein